MHEQEAKDPKESSSEGLGDNAEFYAGLTTAEDEDDEWINDDRSPEEQRNVHFLDMYVHSLEQALSAEEQAELKTWLEALDPVERQRIDADRAEIDKAQQDAEVLKGGVEAKLRETAPELFSGRLPLALESRLDRPYVLGINQSGDTDTPSLAADYLRKFGGLDLRGSSPNQRLLFIDERIARESVDATEHALLEGYYNAAEWGRFVFAFPIEPGVSEPLESARTGDDSKLPSDFFVQTSETSLSGQPDSAINSKYCAGFIDGSGRFNPNAHFMQSAEADFQTAD